MERSRRIGAGAVVCTLALALAGCGGDDGGTAREEAQPLPEPTLPAKLAEKLAEATEKVAEKLEKGDSCKAADEAAKLSDEASAAVEGGEVPEALAAPLLAAVERVSALTICIEEEDADEDEDWPPGKAKGKKDKDKDKDSDGEDD